jgi:aminopeptidase N
MIFDPGDVILKSIKMEKPRALWQRQLQGARLGIDRVLAVAGLAKLVDPESVKALGAALRGDRFWAVRAAAARALGRMRRRDALELLLATIDDAHPRVRRGVVAGLGEFRGDERAAAALSKLLEKGDASYFVEAEAASSLGRTRSPLALQLLPTVAARRSFQDMVRARAIEGLGATSNERAVALVKAEWRPGSPFQSRRAVVMALAELGAGTAAAREAREFIENGLLDHDFRVRGESAAALARLGQGEAIPAIERAVDAELDGRAKRRMNDAVRELREGSKPQEQLKKTQEELDRLRGETSSLRERLEKLEARLDSGKTTPPRGAPPEPKSKRPRPITRRTQRQHRPVRR